MSMKWIPKDFGNFTPVARFIFNTHYFLCLLGFTLFYESPYTNTILANWNHLYDRGILLIYHLNSPHGQYTRNFLLPPL